MSNWQGTMYDAVGVLSSAHFEFPSNEARFICMNFNGTLIKLNICKKYIIHEAYIYNLEKKAVSERDNKSN